MRVDVSGLDATLMEIGVKASLGCHSKAEAETKAMHIGIKRPMVEGNSVSFFIILSLTILCRFWISGIRCQLQTVLVVDYTTYMYCYDVV